uniref:Multiple C2 domains, transmembrane 1b n=1 Tax=Oncorhynchus mykiss TaxID=8022 RepID=A0A8L0DWA4_ONCMY
MVMGATGASGVNSDKALPSSEMYQLDIVLKRGHNLAIRDRGGTSDPYVKFKLCGKEVFRSKTIHKNLNPVWDEGTKLLVDSLQEPLYVKVFDYDFGLQDDFMGSAYLYLESLEQQRYSRPMASVYHLFVNCFGIYCAYSMQITCLTEAFLQSECMHFQSVYMTIPAQIQLTTLSHTKPHDRITSLAIVAPGFCNLFSSDVLCFVPPVEPDPT